MASVHENLLRVILTSGRVELRLATMKPSNRYKIDDSTVGRVTVYLNGDLDEAEHAETLADVDRHLAVVLARHRERMVGPALELDDHGN